MSFLQKYFLSPYCFCHHRLHVTAFITITQQIKCCSSKGLGIMHTAVQLLTWQCLAPQLSSRTQFCHRSLQQVGHLGVSEWFHENQQLTMVPSKLSRKKCRWEVAVKKASVAMKNSQICYSEIKNKTLFPAKWWKQFQPSAFYTMVSWLKHQDVWDQSHCLRSELSG